jgi:hypothetical protein
MGWLAFVSFFCCWVRSRLALEVFLVNSMQTVHAVVSRSHLKGSLMSDNGLDLIIHCHPAQALLFISMSTISLHHPSSGLLLLVLLADLLRV